MSTDATPRDEGGRRPETAVVDDRDAGRLELRRGGAVAYLEYSVADGHLTLGRAELPPEMDDAASADALVGAALEMARRERWHIVPRGQLVRDYIQRHPEAVALMAED